MPVSAHHDHRIAVIERMPNARRYVKPLAGKHQNYQFCGDWEQIGRLPETRRGPPSHQGSMIPFTRARRGQYRRASVYSLPIKASTILGLLAARAANSASLIVARRSTDSPPPAAGEAPCGTESDADAALARAEAASTL